MSARWSGSPDRGPLVYRPAGPVDTSPRRPAAFLDRDGTLNEAVPDRDSGAPESPLSVADVRLIPAAPGAVKKLLDASYALVCVTNQPAAAKGKATLPELLEVHERVLGLLAEQGVRIDVSLLCPHHPEGRAGELARRCDCRKPAPGMLLGAGAELGLDLAHSWMLGDTDADVAAGRAAGCRTVLLDYPPSAHKRSGRQTPDISAPDLATAVAQVLGQPRR
ncbi:MAG TPA: HAD family hydrolase [Solirubrobacteraceae bacterium]|nr:HAD family hydrolase [Solirubrobacteraceae bacterium]